MKTLFTLALRSAGEQRRDGQQLAPRDTTSYAELSDDPRSSFTNLEGVAVAEIAGALRHLLADVFVLYLKTKSFHWHMTGPHFRDYHLLLDEQAAQVFAMTDEIAERARKLGGASLRSIGDIGRHQRLEDEDAQGLSARAMLTALARDNQRLARSLRYTHELCARHHYLATTSLLEGWIDAAERRVWFLAETTQAE